MNSKLFARIAAVAVGASMLSSFAFAEAAAPTITDNTLSFMNGETNIISVPDGAEYVSMMSYLISAEEKAAWETNQTIPTPVDTNIIALDQVKSADVATQLKTVNILADNLNTTMPAAIVRIGNSLGTGGNTWVVALNANGDGYTITFIAGMGKIGGSSTATNTTAADGTVTPVANPETGKAGLVFQYWATKDATTGAYTKFDPATTKATADTELYAVYKIKVGDVDLDGSYSTTEAFKLYDYAKVASNTRQEPKKKAALQAEGYMVGLEMQNLDGSVLKIGDINIDTTYGTTEAFKLYDYAKVASNTRQEPKKKAALQAEGYMVAAEKYVITK